MKCINHRIRTKKGIKYGYCVKYKKEVALYCSCDGIDVKNVSPLKVSKLLTSKNIMKKATYKHYKKEKERFSIIYNDKSKCCICGSKIGHIDTNEVFEGAYRMTSIKYGACNYLCRKCHIRFDNDRLFNLKEKVKFQNKFIDMYGYDWFIDTFKQDYEVKLKKLGG